MNLFSKTNKANFHNNCATTPKLSTDLSVLKCLFFFCAQVSVVEIEPIGAYIHIYTYELVMRLHFIVIVS